jgi:hypothetical protein
MVMQGCGGSKIKKKDAVVSPDQRKNSLAMAVDGSLSATLDWVFIRNSPESWAKNADWDEYVFRFQALPGHQVQVTDIAVYDSLGRRLGHLNDRAELKNASRQTLRNYKDAKLSVKPGAGTGVMAVGATATVLGAAYVAGATAGAGAAGAIGGLAAGAAVAGTMVLLTPVFIVGGIVRGVHHRQVNLEIQRIATRFPIAVGAVESSEVHAFYPFAPSPHRVEISYTDVDGGHKLNIDTERALAGLHMAIPE